MKHVVDNIKLIVIFITILFFSSCLPEETPEPIACFEPSKTSASIGEQITFNSGCSENVTQYGWKFGDGETSNEPNPSHTYTSSGQYEVTLKVYSKSLTNETSLFIDVVGDQPEACFKTDDTQTIVWEEVQFENCSSHASNYVWNFGDGATSTEENPSHVYETPGTYTVALTAENEHTSRTETKEEYITVTEFGLAKVTTSDISEITTSSATSGGNITHDGGSRIYARGVCWSTSSNPTLENNMGFTNDGTGTGEYTSKLTGLSAGTTYYVRAYVTNTEGTAYGTEKVFLTDDVSNDKKAISKQMSVLVDGVIDAKWSEVEQYYIEKIYIGENFNGTQDLSGYWKSCWNEKGLFVLVHVTADDFHYTDGVFGEIWQQDLVEVYFDMNVGELKDGMGPSGGEFFAEFHQWVNQGHHQFSFIAEPNDVLDFTSDNKLQRGFSLNADNSYVQEFFFSWELLEKFDGTNIIPGDKITFGFDVTIADNDGEENGEARNRMVWSNNGEGENGNENWLNMDEAGELTLVVE